MKKKNWNRLRVYKDKLPEVDQLVLLWRPQSGYAIGIPRYKDSHGKIVWRFAQDWWWHPLQENPLL